MELPNITGIILAGGQGQRMGKVDKGLCLLQGKPLVEWVLERLTPQVSQILINANQNISTYCQYGVPVIEDQISGFAGPLAGLHAALPHAEHPLVLTVPCDSPFFPAELVQRLYVALESAEADLAVARTFAQPHPVFCLYRSHVLTSLDAYLAAGNRQVRLWQQGLKQVEVSFDDAPEAFRNVNTREELNAVNQEITSTSSLPEHLFKY